MELNKLLRENIARLKPYSSARDEFKGEASVYLDANENPYNAPYNRYPDPMQWRLKEQIAKIKGVRPEQILLGNGSDEPIDLLFRAFCNPQKDNVVAIDPTYGMYRVCADINDVEYRPVPLDENFQFTSENLLAACDGHTKIIFLCSPNNPSGNNLNRQEIIKTLNSFDGIVVVDEAYIDFAGVESFSQDLSKYPNLVVLQTFSKAWGSAGVRLGMAFASEDIVRVFSKIKYPYNINQLTQEYGLKMLKNASQVKNWINELLFERNYLTQQLQEIPSVLHLYPTDANFILAKVTDANGIYHALVEQGVIVRNRHSVSLCGNCLRITVGTRQENDTLLNALKQL